MTPVIHDVFFSPWKYPRVSSNTSWLPHKIGCLPVKCPVWIHDLADFKPSWHMKIQIVITLLGTNISPPKASFPQVGYVSSPEDTLFSHNHSWVENGCIFERSRYTLSLNHDYGSKGIFTSKWHYRNHSHCQSQWRISAMYTILIKIVMYCAYVLDNVLVLVDFFVFLIPVLAA